MSDFKLIGKLPAPRYISSIEHKDGLNSDIIDTIHKNFPQAVKETAGLAQVFRRGNALDSAKNVWLFLRKKIKYKKDPAGKQLIRLPARFVADGVGDCKSYSLFAAAMLHNMGLPVKFRYAGYTMFNIPTHVYVLTEDEKGNEIIVDGVYKHFNAQKPFNYKKDYKWKYIL